MTGWSATGRNSMVVSLSYGGLVAVKQSWVLEK